LKVSVLDLGDPITVGGKARYRVAITNERTVSDTNVAITLQLSDGLKLTNIAGPTGAAATSNGGRQVDLTSIAEIRAGETVEYRIEATGERAGQQKLVVSVKSDKSQAAVTGQQETTVNAP
jgi:hypothetical protein